jgi:hypothetical protein
VLGPSLAHPCSVGTIGVIGSGARIFVYNMFGPNVEATETETTIAIKQCRAQVSAVDSLA